MNPRPAALAAPFRRENRLATLLWGLVAAGLIAAAGRAGFRLRHPNLAPARFQRLDVPEGTLESARFGPDGRTVYVSLRVGGGPPQLFATGPDGAEPRPLGVRDAILLAVSPSDELYLLQAPRHVGGIQTVGTLARVPARGGTPEVLRDHVVDAAWDPGGLVTVVGQDLKNHLEFPPGRILETWDLSTRVLSHLALSGDGSRLACVDADLLRSATAVRVFRREGGSRTLYTREGDGSGGAITGLAWGPGGALWVSEREGSRTVVWSLAPDGSRKALWQSQGHLQLLDVSREGRALLAQQTLRQSVCARKAGRGTLVDLSIQGDTQLRALSADGRLALLNESPVPGGVTAEDRCFVRTVEGGPPRFLGRGFGCTLSPDGRWMQIDPGPVPAGELDPAWVEAFGRAGLARKDLADTQLRYRYLLFVPLQAGSPFAVPIPAPFEPIGGAAYPLPGGGRMIASVKRGERMAWILLDRRGSPPARVGPAEGDWASLASLGPLSPDGTRFILARGTEAFFLQSLAGGRPEPVLGLRAGERPVGWASDGRSIFVRTPTNRLPVTLTRVDPRTGARRAVADLAPLDPAGFVDAPDALASPDGKGFVFSYQKRFSDLYLVDNLGGGS